MPTLVLSGTSLHCDQGTAPGVLTVSPDAGVAGADLPVATVDDHAPQRNVGAFGPCRSLANPQVAAATAAAQGVLAPQPCAPVLPAPWTPGAAGVTLGAGRRVLTHGATCACAWGGTITLGPPLAPELEADAP